MIPISSILLGIFSLVLSFVFYFSATISPLTISPQGCRMSYMSPSYILQADFDTSWTPLARRYSLWLYREVGFPDHSGVPVLFIPGNAGSSRQVRSIASSATRQYYSSAHHVDPYFSSRNMKPLDFYAVEFNEDLSAFHGPTLEAERQYTSRAIDFILSRYPKGTSIIIMGHSMGGIVATSLLPSTNISSIITMSTPHIIPPARFDSRLDAIYEETREVLEKDMTPILSLCGGITDTMILSEFCVLPPQETGALRKTVFTSSLEGCWTGVGHREMVWCHQVRWRVARVAFELAHAGSEDARAEAIETWFRDGIADEIPKETARLESHREGTFKLIEEGKGLVLKQPSGSHAYALPIYHSIDDDELGDQFVLFVSEGSVLNVSPLEPSALRVSVYICYSDDSDLSLESENKDCKPLSPSTLQLIPDVSPELAFPIPAKGSAESNGIVVFKASLPRLELGVNAWVVVDVRDADGRGWVKAKVEPVLYGENDTMKDVDYKLVPFLGRISYVLDPSVLYTELRLPYLLSNALLAYRATPVFKDSCTSAPLLSPLLLQTSSPYEGHYFPLREERLVLLHSHSSAPYLSQSSPHHVVNLTIFSSGEAQCGVHELQITIDWWHSIARWGARYWSAVLAWAVGIVGILIAGSLRVWDAGGAMPSVSQALESYTHRSLPSLLVISALISIMPLGESFWLGNGGKLIMTPIAPILLALSSGLVCVSWALLSILMYPFQWLSSSSCSQKRSTEEVGWQKRGLFSILLISVLVFLFIPWQVAFMGTYLIHFFNCATDVTAGDASSKSYSGSPDSSPAQPKGTGEREQHWELISAENDARNQKMYVLLMMTWCLPIVAPALAVWVRTLATAGITTPFDGDHFVGNVIVFMVLVYSMSHTSRSQSTTGRMFTTRHSREVIPVGWFYGVGSVIAFVLGPRSTYRIYEAMNWPTAFLFLFRVLPKLMK